MQSLIFIIEIDVDPAAGDSFKNRLFQPFIIQCFVGFECDDKIKVRLDYPIPYLV